MKKGFLPLLLLSGLSSVLQVSETKGNDVAVFAKEGKWRGLFSVEGVEVPFNFEIKGNNSENAHFYLINGNSVDEFKHIVQRGDSLFIRMNTYDAEIQARIESEDRISGVYKSLVPNLRGNGLPFTAEFNKNYRFVEPGKDVAPSVNLTGKWDIDIVSKDDVADKVGVFTQEGNRITGTILQVTGDTRELEGTVQGDNFYLSGFTGPSPVLVRGKIKNGKILTGEILRGIYNSEKFEARKNKKAALPDPYELTFLKEGKKKLESFSFPDLNGNTVTLNDDKYKNKVVIIDIIGTWCPNCTDQTVFLSPWYKENKQRGVEVIAVAFEQKDDLAYAKYQLDKLISKYDIQYDVVFGGINDKKIASEKFPELNKMMAFPTTIVIDRKGEVRFIHTGYSGKATGKYHKEYVKKWTKELDKILDESSEEQLTSSIH